jgi:hypothetical protein
MAKILLNEKALRVQFSDLYPNQFNETSYFNTTVSEDGTNIIITNANDPNFADVTIAYADISFPVTATITELLDLIRTVILNKNGLLTIYNESTDIVTGTLGLQNVGGVLYWNGVALGSGGGGGLTTAYNGLSTVGATDVILGGTLVQNTDIETLDFRFKVEGNDPGFGFNQGLSINANSNQALFFSTTQDAILGWDSTTDRLNVRSGSINGGVYITNDDTNNIILDPTALDINHNTLIRLQFNEGAAKASTISMDNVESAWNYVNSATGAISQHSLNDSYWTATYQSANLASIQLDDNWVRTIYQNGASANVSYVIAQNGDVTLENTDGSTTSTLRVDAANGISLISQTPLFINIPSTPQPVGSVLTLLDNSNGECEWQQLANPTGDSMLIQASDPEILSLNSPNNLIATIGSSSFELPDISTLAVGTTKVFTCYKSVAVGNVALNCTAGATCEGRFGGLFFSGTGGFVLTVQGQVVTLTAVGGSNIWIVTSSNI